jgi:AcrR family transcriptional regulator
MACVAAPLGRREANKQATRAALTAAAQRLFAERGYEATTVRDIARAARVTERTFYRYFDGKEGLLDDEFRAWLALFRGAIAARPAGEPPLTAVHRAMLAVGQTASTGEAPAPLWLFSEFTGQPPVVGGRRSGLRPLSRFEATIADAIAARQGARRDHVAGGEMAARDKAARGGSRDGAAGGGDDGGGDGFRAQVLARVAVAAFRSAVIGHRRLRASGPGTHASLGQLLDEAFAVITGRAGREGGAAAGHRNYKAL